MKYITFLPIIFLLSQSIIFGQNSLPANIDSNVVALWHFDEGSGSVVHDASLYHNDGIIGGNAQWVEGKYGSALHYDGLTSYVKFINSPSLKQYQEFTIEAWITLDTLGFPYDPTYPDKERPIVDNQGAYPYGGGYSFKFHNQYGLTLSYRAGNPVAVFSRRVEIQQSGIFIHVAGVFQRKKIGNDSVTILKTYLNGELKDSSVFSQKIHYSDTPYFYIGSNIDGQALGNWKVRDFKGIIDEIRISKVARHPGDFYRGSLHAIPGRLNFSFVESGHSKTQTVTLVNSSSTDPVSIDSIVSSNDEFIFSGFAATVLPKDSLTLDVTYSPMTRGLNSSVLRVYYHNTDVFQTTILLEGKAYSHGEDTTIVAEWHFDEGEGNVLHDASLYENDGLIGGHTPWVQGKRGKGLSFDGLTSYVKVPNSASLKQTHALTIEAWFNLDTLGFPNISTPDDRYREIISNLGPYPDGGGYELDIRNQLGLRFCYRPLNNLRNDFHGIPIPAAKQFYHAAATFQRTKLGNDSVTIIKTYLNGILGDSSVYPAPIHYTYSDYMYIGSHIESRAFGGGKVREFDGILDEIRISKVVREPSEFNLNFLLPDHGTLNFSYVQAGLSNTKQLTLWNTSATETISIDSIVIPNNEFTFSGFVATVTPKDSVTLDVTYSPTAKGVDASAMRVYYHGADFPFVEIMLEGKAYAHARDTSIVAEWHFDEGEGDTLHDASLYGNDGAIYNAMWVNGKKGSALHFDGLNSYVILPASPSLKLHNEFTVEAWFSLDTLDFPQISMPEDRTRDIISTVGPYPYGGGYQLNIRNQSGMEFGYHTPEPKVNLSRGIPIMQAHHFYHGAATYQKKIIGGDTMIVVKTYLDGVLKDSSAFTNPVHYANTPNLYIGTNIEGRVFGGWKVREFQGIIDEIRISSVALSPAEFNLLHLVSSTGEMNMGGVQIGQTKSKQFYLTNTSLADTVTVEVHGNTHPELVCDQAAFTLLPGVQQVITVTYTPTDDGRDSVVFVFTPGDTSMPAVTVLAFGRGYQVGEAPILYSVKDIPNDQGRQVRLTWFPSKYESPSESLRVNEYSVWRKINDLIDLPKSMHLKPKEGSILTIGERRLKMLDGEYWDFIATIPAVRFEQYSFVAPTLYNTTPHHTHFSTFRIASHTVTGEFFFSEPDSGFSMDNIYPLPPLTIKLFILPNRIGVNWEPADNPDVLGYNVYRSTTKDFLLTDQNRIGTSFGSSIEDESVLKYRRYYYAVTAVDSSFNESLQATVSDGIYFTDADNPDDLPTDFELSQNYPNPFNPGTVISYAVPTQSHVTLKIFTMLGQEVATLVDAINDAGRYSIPWITDGASGIFIYKIEAISVDNPGTTFSKAGKMLFIR